MNKIIINNGRYNIIIKMIESEVIRKVQDKRMIFRRGYRGPSVTISTKFNKLLRNQTEYLKRANNKIKFNHKLILEIHYTP